MPEAKRDDRELLRAAGAGDGDAWAALVERYARLVWSIARGHRLNTADAADAVQTTWLRLVENLDRIVDPDRLAGWLATTVRRESLRLVRRGDRERVGFVPDEPRVADEQTETRILVEERDAALWQAFTRIPRHHQQLLRVLMADPRPTYAAVAALLDMPVGSIGPSRGRALDQLRRAAVEFELLASV